MSWRTTYPTVATVSKASLESLTIWRNELPKPQTDVQKTVARRIATGHRNLIVERTQSASVKNDPFSSIFGDIFNR